MCLNEFNCDSNQTDPETVRVSSCKSDSETESNEVENELKNVILQEHLDDLYDRSIEHLNDRERLKLKK